MLRYSLNKKNFAKLQKILNRGSNDFLEPFSRKKFFPDNVLKNIYKAIEVYKVDKKTKDEIESHSDN